MDNKRFTMLIPDKLHTELKMLSVKHGLTMTEIVTSLIENFVNNNKSKE